MDLLPTDEQDEIIATVRSQLDREFDLHALAASDGAAQVVDAALWARCAELGWFGLGLQEALGGVGYTLAEEALLFAELGAHATPGPFLATVLGGRLAALAGATELRDGILSGTQRIALAEPHGDPDATAGATVSGNDTASGSASRRSLGTKSKPPLVAPASATVGAVPSNAWLTTGQSSSSRLPARAFASPCEFSSTAATQCSRRMARVAPTYSRRAASLRSRRFSSPPSQS